MKSIFRAALTALAIGAVAVPVAPGPALAENENPETAPVIGWGQFTDLLAERQLKQFTGVSGGYVAFILCNGNWYRVQATVAQVVAELNGLNYQPQCSTGDR